MTNAVVAMLVELSAKETVGAVAPTQKHPELAVIPPVRVKLAPVEPPLVRYP